MRSQSKLYLIAYDIREPKRLIRVHKFLKDRALALQYSVFVLEGTEADKLDAEFGIFDRIDPEEDDVRIYTLPARVEVLPLGAADPLPSGVVLVGAGDPLRVRSRPEAGADPKQLPTPDPPEPGAM